MKRILLLLLAPVIVSSCVVDTNTNLKRTPAYLANFVVNQYESTVGACMRYLASEPLVKETVIDNQVRVTFTLISDNAAHVEGSGPDVNFSFDALSLPGSGGRDAFILSNLSFLYDEGNGLQMQMHFDTEMKYDWLENSSPTYVAYSLEPSGVLMSEIYMNASKADYCNLVFDEGRVSYSTSIRQ